MIDITTIIFRVFDFFVVAGVAVFIVKKYIIPAVEKMLKDENILLYNLESDGKNLQLQTQAIYENIQDQDRKFQILRNKFVVWQKTCDARLLVEQQERQLAQVSMLKNFETKLSFLQNHLVLQQQIPKILDAVTRDLQKKYSKVDDQKEYINTLIHEMKE